MLRKYALTVVFLFVVCGAAAQLPDDEYYPYGTGYEQRTPIVLTDSSLFYRAIQTMPDLYGSISAFNLPYIALGRRGQHYSSEAASFSGLGISSRYFGSLRLLGEFENGEVSFHTRVLGKYLFSDVELNAAAVEAVS